MDFPRGYDYYRDEASGMWRITSPSGHLLYESRWHVHVARVCQRLNGQFARPRREPGASMYSPIAALQPALMV